MASLGSALYLGTSAAALSRYKLRFDATNSNSSRSSSSSSSSSQR
jgi:hypothetical protein